MIKSEEKTLPFRYSYIVLPLVILLVSVIATFFSFRMLPASLAYQFSDGSPDRWMERSAAITWLLVPQFLFTLFALGVVFGVGKLCKHFPNIDRTLVSKLMYIMGNMLALPQLVLGFAMLDIFIYNSYQIHLMPFLTFALIVLGAGVIILGISFILVVRRVWSYPLRRQVSRSK